MQGANANVKKKLKDFSKVFQGCCDVFSRKLNLRTRLNLSIRIRVRNFSHGTYDIFSVTEKKNLTYKIEVSIITILLHFFNTLILRLFQDLMGIFHLQAFIQAG